MCKCFVHEIIKEVVLITFQGAKINEIHFPLYGGSPCSNAQTDGVYLYFNMIKLSEMVRIRVADHFYYFFREVFEKSGKNTILNCKGYVRLQCHAKCSIDYHPLCWKHKKDHDVI